MTEYTEEYLKTIRFLGYHIAFLPPDNIEHLIYIYVENDGNIITIKVELSETYQTEYKQDA